MKGVSSIRPALLVPENASPQAIHRPRSGREIERQSGFSLVEVSIVTAIVLLLAILGLPAVGHYIIENKVPKVGEELARYMLQTQVNAPAGIAEPYAQIATRNFANTVRGSPLFSVTGTEAAPQVMHGLGADGQVSVAPVSLGLGFSVTLTNVSDVACPSIASVMQRVSDSVSIGGVVVKDDATPYSALAAEAECTPGENNTFVFSIG
jgi:prepilin-type N-terminal cleavage/methylation domain-containing protein